MKTILVFAALIGGAFLRSSPAGAKNDMCYSDPPGPCFSVTEAENDKAYRAVVDHLFAITNGENPAKVLQPLFMAVAEVNAQRGHGYDVLKEMGITRYKLADAITAYFHAKVLDSANPLKPWSQAEAGKYAFEMGETFFQLLAFYDETGDTPHGVSKRQPVEGKVLKNLVYPDWGKTPAAPIGRPAEVAPPQEVLPPGPIAPIDPCAITKCR
ncbi:MAG: hypothetical protein HYS44_03885 [Candidatus Niyogibacteria bacterium]|nr:hypothetical protein [Candidatus Niyogibacteria bacterium]